MYTYNSKALLVLVTTIYLTIFLQNNLVITQSSYSPSTGDLKILHRPLVTLKNLTLPDGFLSKLSQDPSIIRDHKFVVAIDAGGIRGIIPLITLINLESQIKGHILKYPVGNTSLNLINGGLQTKIVSFRNQRLGLSNQTINQVEVADFDINLSDFIDFFAGCSTGTIISSYLAIDGTNKARNLKALLLLIIELQKFPENVQGSRILLQDLKIGLSNKAFDIIIPNIDSAYFLYLFYYHAWNPLLGVSARKVPAPTPTPSNIPLDSTQQNLAQTKKLLTPFFLQGLDDYGAPIRSTPQASGQEIATALAVTTASSAIGAQGVTALLKAYLMDRQLSDSKFYKTSIYIVATDITNARAVDFFNFKSRNESYGVATTNRNAIGISLPTVLKVSVPLSEAVRASTAAPLNLPGIVIDLQQYGQVVLIDGGLISTDPAPLALQTYTRELDVKVKNLNVLSLGCGSATPTSKFVGANATLAQLQLQSLISNSQNTISPFYSDLLQEATQSYIRITPIVTEQQDLLVASALGLGSQTLLAFKGQVDILSDLGEKLFKNYTQTIDKKFAIKALEKALLKIVRP